jgi:hypothetical protein
MMKSPMACAAHVLNPELHSESPWDNPGMLAGFTKYFEQELSFGADGKKVSTEVKANQITEMKLEFANYKAKMGQYSSVEIWKDTAFTKAGPGQCTLIRLRFRF